MRRRFIFPILRNSSSGSLLRAQPVDVDLALKQCFKHMSAAADFSSNGRNHWLGPDADLLTR